MRVDDEPMSDELKLANVEPKLDLEAIGPQECLGVCPRPAG
jgi:hypothetical protein